MQPELERLVQLATVVLNEHVNHDGLCAVCGCAFPCEAAVGAAVGQSMYGRAGHGERLLPGRVARSAVSPLATRARARLCFPRLESASLVGTHVLEEGGVRDRRRGALLIATADWDAAGTERILTSIS